MAPSALLPEPEVEAPAIKIAAYSPNAKHTEWYADLQANGYTVLKNAIPKNRAVAYQQRALAWLSSFGTELDISKPETWIKSNLPIQSKINTFYGYSVAHEKFVWDARMESGVIEAFETLWGTDELLVSFDTINITLPNRKDVQKKEPWEHVDQSPLRRGLHCVQGIINLSEAGPEDGGLMVLPGSHKLVEEFFDTETDKSTWDPEDSYPFTPEQLAWFFARGITPHKVCAEPGDLILWDSRTIHYGAEPTEKSNTIRTVIYAAYTPAKFATKEALETKAKIFEQNGGTTHWPHDNIKIRNNEARFEDGTLDPRDRKQPLEKPEMTDKLLKLAGVMPY